MSETGTLNVGDMAPDFTLVDQDGHPVRLSDLRGRWVVVYFYPKDDTPGCTTEAIAFSRQLQDFTNAGAVILGISPDSTESHCNFIAKYDLKITLLSDTDRKVLETYGAWGLKKNYGKEFMGVIRSTFLVDPQGRLAYIWRNVKADGHAEQVKATLAEIQSRATV